MSGYLSLQTAVLRGALRGSFSLQNRTWTGPAAAVGFRFASDAPKEGRTALIESTEEYKFVERLIAPSLIPDPPKHVGPAPSGWVPPPEVPPPLPYMIRRSRMHNVPVYSETTHGNRHITMVRKVEGDIWALEKEVREYLSGVAGKELPTQVNEVTMTLKIKGQFREELKKWLISKGF